MEQQNTFTTFFPTALIRTIPYAFVLSFVGQTKEKFHSVLFNKKLRMHQLSIAVPAPDVYSVYHTSEECFWRALIGWLRGD